MKNFFKALKAFGLALIGIGSKEDLERDFAQIEEFGPLIYIIVGLIMTIIFILTIVFVVNIVLVL